MDRTTVKAEPEETGDAFAAMEFTLSVDTPGPAPHIHRRSTEFFYVLDGQGEFRLGGTTRRGGPGTSAVAPAGVVHSYSNIGQKQLRILAVLAPGELLKMAQGFAEAYPHGGGEPDPAKLADVLQKYDIQIVER